MKKGFIIAIIILLAYLVLMIVLFTNEDPNKPTKQEKQAIDNYFEYEKDDVIVKKVQANNTGINKVKEQIQSFGITGYETFEPASYVVKRLNESNLDYLKKNVLTEQDLKNLNYNEKIEFDFDDDGDLEQLLLVSNVTDTNAKKWFSAVYYIDKKINRIVLDEYDEFSNLNIYYQLINIVDLNNDGKYEIVLKMMPQGGECYNIYELQNNIYKHVTMCEVSPI